MTVILYSCGAKEEQMPDCVGYGLIVGGSFREIPAHLCAVGF